MCLQKYKIDTHVSHLMNIWNNITMFFCFKRKWFIHWKTETLHYIFIQLFKELTSEADILQMIEF